MKQILVLIIMSLMFSFLIAGDQENPYNPELDVKQEINHAIIKAQAENKHILLKFGANWCPWCRMLYKMMHENIEISQWLKDNYIVILVDIGETKDKPLNRDLVAQYRVEGFGYPSLAVLDKKGKLLSAQSTGVLESEKGHDSERVMGFLKALAPRNE